ncbi:uncharacterized protein LOC108666631, partial [Hyalella azteca]|uniref:Uncharacterized protein LOC108666631 n=1 Tax=Hyalella azteca TaxID=294128 RepID=A0A979FVB5_HYAAZ
MRDRLLKYSLEETNLVHKKTPMMRGKMAMHAAITPFVICGGKYNLLFAVVAILATVDSCYAADVRSVDHAHQATVFSSFPKEDFPEASDQMMTDGTILKVISKSNIDAEGNSENLAAVEPSDSHSSSLVEATASQSPLLGPAGSFPSTTRVTKIDDETSPDTSIFAVEKSSLGSPTSATSESSLSEKPESSGAPKQPSDGKQSDLIIGEESLAPNLTSHGQVSPEPSINVAAQHLIVKDKTFTADPDMASSGFEEGEEDDAHQVALDANNHGDDTTTLTTDLNNTADDVVNVEKRKPSVDAEYSNVADVNQEAEDSIGIVADEAVIDFVVGNNDSTSEIKDSRVTDSSEGENISSARITNPKNTNFLISNSDKSDTETINTEIIDSQVQGLEEVVAASDETAGPQRGDDKRRGRESKARHFLTVAEEDILQQPGSDVKPGRCPSRVIASELCPVDVADQCAGDSDCSGAAKCCTTGCARVCVRPLHSACELQRENTLRHGRALGLSAAELQVPDCDDQQGTFVSVQCRANHCYCADPLTGYEVPGTRARSIHEVNCS